MVAALSVFPNTSESIFDVAKRLADLIGEAAAGSVDGKLPDGIRERAVDLVEALRKHVIVRPERDLRSLFDIDERLVDLMDRVEEAAEAGEIPEELLQEASEYLEAFRTKVDRIAGYWRWQESIARICGEEAERLSARKKAADGRLNCLKSMLLAFMSSRGLKKLEGEKAAIGMQANGNPSLVIDDPVQIGERFFENSIRFTKTELQEIVYQLAEGELRRRLETILSGDGWEINASAVRSAMAHNVTVSGARLVKGHHVRLR